MTTSKLWVPVNDELVLDAGTWEWAAGSGEAPILVRPPVTSMYEQLIAYLESKPDPMCSNLSGINQDALTATTLCVRWGTYLAVLMDSSKPLWSHANDTAVSAISNGEMARINIEASAALERWLNLYQVDDGRTARSLARRILAYLPVYKTIAREEDGISFLASDQTSQVLLRKEFADQRKRFRVIAQDAPYRVIANTLINYAFRCTTTIEDVHAGKDRGSPLDRRRISLKNERGILREVNARMKHAMSACFMLSADKSGRSKTEQALPFVVSLSYPHNWSVTETSREIYH